MPSIDFIVPFPPAFYSVRILLCSTLLLHYGCSGCVVVSATSVGSMLLLIPLLSSVYACLCYDSFSSILFAPVPFQCSSLVIQAVTTPIIYIYNIYLCLPWSVQQIAQMWLQLV